MYMFWKITCIQCLIAISENSVEILKKAIPYLFHFFAAYGVGMLCFGVVMMVWHNFKKKDNALPKLYMYGGVVTALISLLCYYVVSNKSFAQKIAYLLLISGLSMSISFLILKIKRRKKAIGEYKKQITIGSSETGKVRTFIKPEQENKIQENHLIDMSELAIKVKDYPELPRLMMLNDMPAKFKCLVELKENVPADLYAAYARWSYQMSTLDVPLELLYQVFDNVDRNLLMSENEQETFNSLPEYITIYRGSKLSEEKPRLSWSLDENIAMKYYQGRLFKAIVKKEEIIACFSDDCENEVLAYVPENFEITE